MFAKKKHVNHQNHPISVHKQVDIFPEAASPGDALPVPVAEDVSTRFLEVFNSVGETILFSLLFKGKKNPKKFPK